ncbi:hypothetical protein FQN54_002473 [Arachnomyces sp. PD_36]|nr:hypothetical protein FQN54_002473 [Arachnomyces sp. PD_36]
MYDFVLLGATGFTGTLCAKFITNNYPTDIKWSIAGRSYDKLETLAEELMLLQPDRRQPDIECVDFGKDDLELLVKQTRLVINGVGPYHRHSTPVVEACARFGTHYVDFTTETLWVKELTEKYAEMAQASGALLIPAISPCAPSDLLAYLIATKIRDSCGTGTSEVVCSGKLDIKAMSSGSFNTVLDSVETYGPWWYLSRDSWILSLRSKPRRVQRKPWVTRLFGYRYAPELGSLTTSFTASGNESIVHRSSSQSPEIYGPNFHFNEYTPAKGFVSAFIVHILTIFGVILISFSPIRSLLRGPLRPINSEPDIAEARRSEWVKYHAVGKADNEGSHGKFRVYASLARAGALYEFTALLACVGARVLLETRIEAEKEGRQFSGKGGIMTPSALGVQYVERLKEAGVEIDVVSLG